MGYPRRIAQIDPNFNATREMRGIAKIAEPITSPAEVANVMRRAFTQLRNGRGGPVIVEVPADMWNEEVPEPLELHAGGRAPATAPDPAAVKEAAAAARRRRSGR